MGPAAVAHAGGGRHPRRVQQRRGVPGRGGCVARTWREAWADRKKKREKQKMIQRASQQNSLHGWRGRGGEVGVEGWRGANCRAQHATYCMQHNAV